tara:strand:+ start:1682 stop:2086 length:405 start_codon:yes stop_codon:yes gene_type:complete
MNDTLKKMTSLAKNASSHSYSPYSNFAVGCCVLTKDQQFFVGCNIENASFPCGQCAEAVAVANMVSQGAREIDQVLVYAQSNQPCWPCGLCRQILNEFGSEKTLVHTFTQNKHIETANLADLLAKSFNNKTMEQ